MKRAAKPSPLAKTMPVAIKAGLFAAAYALAAASCGELGTTTSSGATRRTEPGATRPDDAPATSRSGVYAVTFGVRSGARLGAIQFEARPRQAGRWQGRGAKVACANITGAAMHACNEKSSGVLACGLIDTNGIPASSDLVRCVFESETPVSAGDFSVRVVDASNTATKPVRAEVMVTRVKAR